MDNTLIKKTIRISQVTEYLLKEESNKAGKSENAIINDALNAYLNGRADQAGQIADQVIAKFDKKYNDYMKKLHFAAGAADKNSRILLDIANSRLFRDGITDKAYMSVNTMKHNIIKQAEDDMKMRIAISKQKVDDKKYNRYKAATKD